MYLGRVSGCVWSTMKDRKLQGRRLLLVQPVNRALEPAGRAMLCTDATGAGAGELVYYTRGREAAFPFLPDEVPTDATVVAVVDCVT